MKDGLIVVVDDDGGRRRSIEEMLAELGYLDVMAGTGAQRDSIAQGCEERVKLLIVSETQASAGGLAVLQEMQPRFPRAQFVLMRRKPGGMVSQTNIRLCNTHTLRPLLQEMAAEIPVAP